MIWKEKAVAYFNIVSRHLSGGADKK